MRDKVKRFISILMTALMLVNLMPVGALADGIISSGYKPEVAAVHPVITDKVYVYAKIEGTKPDGVQTNNSGWYTIGYIDNVDMPSPWVGGWNPYYNSGDACGYNTTFANAASLITGKNFHHRYNLNIPVKNPKAWLSKNDCGFKACDGADNYVGNGIATWHLNIFVKIEDIQPAHELIFKDRTTGEEIKDRVNVKGTKGTTRTYRAGDEYVPESITKDGKQYDISAYNPNLDKAHGFDYVTTEIEIFYDRVSNLSYTVNYYWVGDTSTKIAKSFHGTANLNTVITPETENVKKDISGYTFKSASPESLTISSNENANVLNLYYYKNVTLTAKSDEFKYDGTQKSVSGYECSVKGLKFKGITAGARGTNAGEYTAVFSEGTVGKIDKTGKYKVTEAKDGTLTINKRNVTLTSADDEKVYDGNALTNDTVTVGGEGFVGKEGATYNVTGTQTNVGESKNTFTYELKDGTKAGNYEITPIEGTLKVTPVTDTVTVKIKENSGTEKYDGTEKTVTGYTVESISNPLYTKDDFKFTGKAEVKGTDAGTYDMELKASDFQNTNTSFAKVTFVIEDGTLTITKRNVTLTSATDSKVYDGEPLTNDKVTVGGDGFVAGEVTEIKATGSVKDVSEGEVTNAITFTKGEKFNEDNYAIEKNEGKLSITPREVKLTSANLIKVYDGTPLKNGDTPVKEEFGTEDAFPDGEGVTYTFKGSQTNAGSSKNMFTYAWNEGTNKDNYTIYQVEGDLVVTPIDGIKVTITGHKDTQTYDGKEHSVFGFDAKPSNKLYNPKEDMQFNGTDVDMTAKGTDAGQYNIGLTAEHFTNKSNNFTNVEFVVEDGQLEITPRAVTLTSETAGKTYDGTALEKPVVTVGGDGFVEGQVKEIKATGSVTNAGSVANTITFTPNKETFKEGNYAITKTEGTLTINKRSVLITSQSATKTYDGSALTRPAVTITGDGFVPGELAKAEATGSITNVGSTPNAIQYTTTGAFNAANYSIALSVGTLTVTEKPQPEPRRTFNLTINYVYQNGKRAAASYNRGGLKNGETFDITSPVIAGYTASETVVSGTIYNRDIKVTVIYTADGVNLDDYGVPLGLGNITMNVGDCFE